MNQPFPINYAALKLVFMFLSQGFMTFLDISLVSQLGENIAKRLKDDLFADLIEKELSFFDSNMQGQLSSRLNMDISEFKVSFPILLNE